MEFGAVEQRQLAAEEDIMVIFKRLIKKNRQASENVIELQYTQAVKRYWSSLRNIFTRIQ